MVPGPVQQTVKMENNNFSQISAPSYQIFSQFVTGQSVFAASARWLTLVVLVDRFRILALLVPLIGGTKAAAHIVHLEIAERSLKKPQKSL